MNIISTCTIPLTHYHLINDWAVLDTALDELSTRTCSTYLALHIVINVFENRQGLIGSCISLTATTLDR